ncbi:HAD family hydrolase [Pelagibacterium montanilacus]|uniref:HAD family hydrolase n=1 Tax=Pelagibacterium montanilacus TaxID=2185280 RepID=UPI000F8E0C5E|nr:HAD family phosphatase [Pelagibacterium montanilacus]
MTPRFSLVAWDVDGTLVDSEPLHQKVLVSVCADQGVDLSDIDDDRFLGVHIDDVWEALSPRFGSGVERQLWLDQIIGRYVEAAGELEPVAGAIEAMAAFHEAGIRQVCVSNSNRMIVSANLAAIGVDRFVDFSITLDDVTAGKPAPEPYERALKRLGVSPGTAVAVEDSPTGAFSARAAGMKVIALEHQAIGDADWSITDLFQAIPIVLPGASVKARGEESTANGL